MASNLSTRRVDGILTEAMLAIAQDDSFLLGMQQGILPIVNVSPDRYKGVAKNEALARFSGDRRLIGTGGLQRAPDAQYPETRTDAPMEETAYECIEHSEKGFVDTVTASRENINGRMLAAQTRVGMGLWRDVALDFEYQVFTSNIFTAGNWTSADVTALTGGTGTEWDTGGSTPIKDGLAVRNLIVGNTGGVAPDTGYMTQDVLQVLRYHEETFGMTYAGTAATVRPIGPISDDAVLDYYRRAWRLDRLYAVESQYNTANPEQTASFATTAGTKQLWMGCTRGALPNYGAGETVSGIQLGAGPASFVVIKENMTQREGAAGMRGPLFWARWDSENPPGQNLATGHSFSVIRPTGMKVSAYHVAGVLT